jgi:PTS system fructose-specific IIC component
LQLGKKLRSLGFHVQLQGQAARMRVTDVLDETAIVVGKSWPSLEATVRALAERLVAAGRLPQEVLEETVRGVCARERENSTAMVDIGVSIPHVRTAGVAGVACALAVDAREVYSVAFGLPISIVALVVSSPQTAELHLEFLSALSMLFQSAECRSQLKRATSPQEVWVVLRGHDGSGGRFGF